MTIVQRPFEEGPRADRPQTGVDGSLYRRLTWLALAAGALLRAARYAANSSLWGDETTLALSIMQRSFGGLTQPLDYDQSAPVGFLFLVKAATLAFGNGELALRLVPFLAGSAALAAFPLLARRVLGDRAAFLATLMFALADPEVFYAAQVKQYSMEVLVALLFTVAALDLLHKGASATRTVILGLTAAIGVLFSSSLVFLLAAVGAALSLEALRRRDRRLALAAAAGIAPGAAAFAVVYEALLRGAHGTAWMLVSWRHFFLPFPPRTLSDLAWPARMLYQFFTDPLGLPWPPLAVAVTVAGAVTLIRKRQPFAVVAAAVTLAALLGASALKVYPFAVTGRYGFFEQVLPYTGRLLLFATPLVLCLAAQGLDSLIALSLPRLPRRLAPAAGWLAALALLAPVALLVGRNAWSPPVIHELRPLMKKIDTSRRPGDVYIAHYFARSVFEYYNRLLGWNVPYTAVQLREPRDLAPFKELLGRFRPGDRFWFVALDHPFWEMANDRRMLLALMNKRALELATFTDRSAEAHLFVVVSP